jgi:hypothetical protein
VEKADGLRQADRVARPAPVALGANRVVGHAQEPAGGIHPWCVMEAPTGQRFCVVRPQSADFADDANQWS